MTERTNTARKLYTQEAPKREPLRTWMLTPQSLGELILFQRERLEPEILWAVPLTRDFRSVLLDYSHFLSRRARGLLLLRLAAAPVFDEMLLTVLCEQAARSTRIEALMQARSHENYAAAQVLEGSLGADAPAKKKAPLHIRAWERLCGLAY